MRLRLTTRKVTYADPETVPRPGKSRKRRAENRTGHRSSVRGVEVFILSGSATVTPEATSWAMGEHGTAHLKT